VHTCTCANEQHDMAFDFDEMEAEAEMRLAAGDDEAARIALGSAEPPAPWRGDVLPPMRNIQRPKSQHLPSTRDLPAYFPKMQFKELDASGIRARLFVFYGAGDSVAAWANFLTSLPDGLDAAVFECPGHGQRSKEDIPDSVLDQGKEAFAEVSEVLKDHAKGGRLEGAPFAMLGHSMGVQVLLEVALLLKRNLGLEPKCIFAIDRGAPHLPLYNEEGYRLLCLDEPEEFFEGFNPMIHRMMLRPSRHQEKETERMIRMWQKDLKRAQEHLWPEGHHIFHCDIHVFRAMGNFFLDSELKDGKAIAPEAKRVHDILCKITKSGPESSSIWSWGSYEEWKHWTAESCRVHNIEADHVSIKDHAKTIEIIKMLLQ